MPSPPDRPVHILEQQYPAFPLPPLNLVCSSGYNPGVFDIRWSSPSELPANSNFSILGVNIYRSFNSEKGPYFRLNASPVGSNFYRDRTDVVVAIQEDVSQSFSLRGPTTDGDSRYVFRTKNKPIVITPAPGSQNVTNLNVQVTVNGVPAFVESIESFTGEIELRRFPSFDPISQITTPAVLPLNPNDVVLATYKYVKNFVRTDLSQRIFYRIASVAVDPSGSLIETPLNRAAQTNNFEIEKLDYIWREAIRRQRWILDQGGERVKLFIRRSAGPVCGCVSSSHKQAKSDCPVCYATGIIGGYDGPYDITIAPDDAPKKVAQGNLGRTVEHTYDTWTLPSPLVSQRDFIVKLNNDRYGIGPVRMPSNRGMQLQQFFPISYLDESEIRYKVPVPDPRRINAPQTHYVSQGTATLVTERSVIPDEREIRGTTPTFENHHRR